MNCGKFEEQIALYAGGDLDEKGSRLLEEHLSVCGPCRELRDALTEDRLLLRQPPAIDDAVRLSVRERVLAATARLAKPPARWKWAVAASVLIGLLGSWWMTRSFRAEPPGQKVARALERRGPASHVVAAAQSPTRLRRSRPAVHRILAKDEPAPAPNPVLELALSQLLEPEKPRPRTAASSPVVMKLVTDDPDVIVLWLEPRTGEANE